MCTGYTQDTFVDIVRHDLHNSGLKTPPWQLHLVMTESFVGAVCMLVCWSQGGGVASQHIICCVGDMVTRRVRIETVVSYYN